MGRAEQDEVVEGGLAAVGPVPDVVAVEALGGGTAGEAASAIAVRERAAYRGRNAAGAAPDAQRLAVRSIDDGDDAASQQSLRAVSAAMAVRCSISQRPAPPFERTSASTWTTISWRSRGKCGGIARFEHPLGHPRQRIGAAHRARRSSHERPTWDVGGRFAGVASLWASGRFANTGSGHVIDGGRVGPRRPTWDVIVHVPVLCIWTSPKMDIRMCSHAHYADHRAGCRAGPSAGNAAYRQEHESRRERRATGRSRDAGQSTPVASFRRVASGCSRTPSRSSRGSTSTGSISSSMSWRRTNAPVHYSGDRSRRQPSPCNPIASEARRRAATVCPGA